MRSCFSCGYSYGTYYGLSSARSQEPLCGKRSASENPTQRPKPESGTCCAGGAQIDTDTCGYKCSECSIVKTYPQPRGKGWEPSGQSARKSPACSAANSCRRCRKLPQAMNDRANWGARTSRTIQRNGLLMAIQRNGPLQFHCVDSCREAIFQTITKRLQAGSDEPVLQVIAIHQDILSH